MKKKVLTHSSNQICKKTVEIWISVIDDAGINATFHRRTR